MASDWGHRNLMPLTLGTIAKSPVVPSTGLTISATNTYGSSADATTHAINLPSGIVAGNLLAVFVTTNGELLTTPSGWTAFAGSPTSSNTRIFASYKIASGTEGSTLSITALSSCPVCCIAYRITNNRNGVVSNTDLATFAGTFTSTNAPNPGSTISPWGSAENLWILPLAYDSTTATVTGYPTGYNLGQATVVANRLFSMVSCATLKTAGTENPDPYALSASRSGSYLVSVIRPV